ncbi:uncharacterized protein LOC105202374 [Solenopsis invicta]|uniref:uncharacterized protein LOC105202374 n=1 Tax=Solenopsis invicta TaxID=13686 RepID=UPI000595E9B1|nr:uncharacterized protein LOC105202374 [Solenopsis invicta]XP_039312814.1 uncharacterized protein LOC105202374 [Solenopsis invicta]XP_039312815.1 uncharacterized protein LOC105202374 [Solenopsis invicta]
MKLIALGLILICCNVWAAKTSPYANMIEDALIKLKDKLKKGDEKLGLPVMDPFKSDFLDIDLNEDAIKLKGFLKKINIDGLSAYDIVKADFELSPVSVDLHLKWPLVVASTNYSVNGKADEFEIFGTGKIDLSAHQFAFETHVEAVLDGGIFDGYLRITDMTLKLMLEALEFQATGLYDDEELSKVLSAVISDMAPKIVTSKDVVKEVLQFVRNTIDPILAKTKFMDLIKLLS